MLQRIFIAVVIFTSVYVLMRLIRSAQIRTTQRAAKSLQPQESIRILYFSAMACQQCHGQEQILEDVIRNLDVIKVSLQKYPVERHPELTRQWGVKTVPTTVIVDPDGEVLYVNNGLITAQSLAEQLQN